MAQILYQKKSEDYEVGQIEAAKSRLKEYGFSQCSDVSDTHTKNGQVYLGSQQTPTSVAFWKSVRFFGKSNVDTVAFENKAGRPIEKDSEEHKILKGLEEILKPEIITNFKGDNFTNVDEAVRFYNIRQTFN